MNNSNADLSSLKIDRSEKNNPPDRKKYLIPLLVIITAAVLFLIFFGLPGAAVEVNTSTAVLQSSSNSSSVLSASGYVVAQRKAAIASKGTGRLVFLGVVEGDRVSKNEIVARLEDNDFRAQLEEAKANLQLQMADLDDSRNNFNRQKSLLEKGSTSQQSFEGAESNYKRVLAMIEIAKAQVNAAEVNLENTLIRAPFDGTVLTKNAEVGEIVAPLGASATSRAAVITIADMSSLQVEADVSESNIDKIKLNQDCEITLDAYPGINYPGYVAKVVPTADRSKATVLVKVAFKEYDDKVLPEMSAKVSFLSEPVDTSAENAPALIIPISAVVKRGDAEFVYLVKDDKAVEQQVTTGRLMNKYIEIVSGIKAGDMVIESPGEEIKNGTSIKAVDKE